MCCVEKYRHEKERMIKMLEVKNLTFKVNENGIERSIVKNISFCVEPGRLMKDKAYPCPGPVVDIKGGDIFPVQDDLSRVRFLNSH